MTEEKGILDEVEELVSDFQKKKSPTTLFGLSTLDFFNKYVNMDKNLTDFQKQYLNHLDGNFYRQEYPPELEYNRRIKAHCRCGVDYDVFIKQDEELAYYMRNVREPDSFANCFEKRFHCIKCGAMSRITMHSTFEIVSIKHTENFQI